MQRTNMSSADYESISIEFLVRRGEIEAARGNRDGALACYRHVLRLDSANETALWQYAMLTQDVYEARIVLQRLLQINPQHDSARALLVLAEQRYEEAQIIAAEAAVPQQWEKYVESASDNPMPPLGEFLIRHGILTPLQVQAALDFQHAERSMGNTNKRLGEILVLLEYLNQPQLEAALTALKDDFNSRLS